MERLLKEFYEANKRPIWFSEASQIRQFKEWASEHGHQDELRFIDGKRNKVITYICVGLAISFIAAVTLGWDEFALNFFPMGPIIFIFLPMLSKRTPTLTRAEQVGDGKPDPASS